VEKAQQNTSKLLVITAPSGAGKTTIVKHLLSVFDELSFSISATTRAKRPHEQEGVDYYFHTPEEFKAHIAQGDFIEWEEVYANQYYGTLKSEVERLRNLGKHVIFDIDVRGATNIKRNFAEDCCVIFIKPPSFHELLARLKARQTESDASFAKRVARMRVEMTYENTFDRILVNDLLEVALAEAELLVEEFVGIKASEEE